MYDPTKYVPLDNNGKKSIEFTLNEIRIVTSFAKKIQELFPEDRHYFIHKTTNVLIKAFERQLSDEEKKEVGL